MVLETQTQNSKIKCKVLIVKLAYTALVIIGFIDL